jgi:hypothetical protein
LPGRPEGAVDLPGLRLVATPEPAQHFVRHLQAFEAFI